MSFLDVMREMIGAGEAFRGGKCPKCRQAVLATTREGLMRLQCTNCTWSVLECERCEGSGFEGYDSKCCDCGTSGVRVPRPSTCPSCGSHVPNRHPITLVAVGQHCPDGWHRTEQESR